LNKLDDDDFEFRSVGRRTLKDARSPDGRALSIQGSRWKATKIAATARRAGYPTNMRVALFAWSGLVVATD
jgi:hypothetical protein